MKCPACHQEVKRVKGKCSNPECKTPLELFKGRLYRKEDGAPNVKILKRFEELVRSSMSMKANGRPVPFYISPRIPSLYRRETIAAETLLELTDGDIQLVLDTLETMFSDKDWAWKQYSSMVGMFTNDFNQAMAKTVAMQEARQAEAQKKQDVASAVDARTNIFGY